MFTRTWGYNELPKGFYSATVGTYNGDKYMFRACPNRGDWCVEGIYDNQEDAIDAAERWVAGEKNVPGIYSASGW